MKNDMNRRRYPRLEIDIPATIEFQGRVFEACRLFNFSRGGAYLQCPDPSLQTVLDPGYFPEHERQEARLELPSESLSLAVRIVYFNNQGLGLSCSDSVGSRLFETLQNRLQRERGRRLVDVYGRSPASSPARDLLEQLEARSHHFLEARLDAFSPRPSVSSSIGS